MSQVVQAFSHGLSHVPARGSPPRKPPVTSGARCPRELPSCAHEGMPEGIWGGTTLEERRAARRRPLRRLASVRSRDTVRVAMTGESAPSAGQRVPPGRTAR